MTDTNDSLSIMSMVADIVAGYVSRNEVKPEDMPAFIQLIQRSLCALNARHAYTLTSRSEPAVPIEDSVQPDYIICLEDGRRMKMLKRHLKTAYNMTPEQYRERWNLPASYPMVAPAYATKRQNIAKNIGLGTHRKGQKKVAA